MLRNWGLTVGMVLMTGTLFAQLGLTLAGQREYQVPINDIWGYTDPTGHEYALVGMQNGVSIVDLAVPSSPIELHFIPGLNSVWRDLKTYSHYAYVTNESGNGVLIIDMAGLPGSIVSKDTIMNGLTTAHNLYIEGDQMYVVGTNNFNGGIVRFDLGPDPWNPIFLSAYTDRYVHDVYVKGDTAYSAEISDGLLGIIDYSDPFQPVVLSTTTYLNSFTHNTWLNDNGSVVFTTDELDAAFVYAWDVTDPTSPVLIDGIRSSLSEGRATPHNVHVKDDFLVTSYYRDGIQIVDASRPHNLIEVGFYDTNTLEDGGFEGVWGAFPFFDSNLILATDRENGLFIFQPTYQRGCYLEGTIRDAVTMAPISNIDVEIIGQYGANQSLTNGEYAAGTALAGTYQVVFSRYGYIRDTISVNLTNGVVTNLDVDLVPIGRVPLKVTVKDATTLAPIPGAKIKLIAPNNEAEFLLSTISNGQSEDSYFVINEYEFILGKWGYQYQEAKLQVDSISYEFEFLLTPGYEDNFALDLGWEVTGDAERGMWERGEPQGTYRLSGDIYNPELDLPFDIGKEAYVTGNSGGEPFGDDVDNGFTLLTSPVMDLSQYQEPVIEYSWWFLNWSLKFGGTPANDFFSVSITDGIDTFEIKRYVGPFDTTWNAETQFYFLKYFPDLNRDLQVLFYTQDFETGNQDAVEAALDGFRVKETAATSIQNGLTEAVVWMSPVEPGSASISWRNAKGNLSLEIFDITGRKIITKSLNPVEGQQTISFPSTEGIYLVRLSNESGTLFLRKWNAQR